MTTNTITGSDTLSLNNHIFNDLAFGDVSSITFTEKRVNAKTGKNKNTIYAQNAPGQNAKAVLRIVRGSNDDKFLQTIIAQQDLDFAGSALMTGIFSKRLGDGQGNVTFEVYNLNGGIVEMNPSSKSNSDGDVEQGVVVYDLFFSYAVRSNQ